MFWYLYQKYYLMLARQLAAKKKKQVIGTNLSPELMENFNDEQISQLHELFSVATTRETTDSENSW